ncbi:MAG: hypothetical protein EZS28_049359, partial [Streblomastix strix]
DNYYLGRVENQLGWLQFHCEDCLDGSEDPPFLNQSNYKNRSLNPHQSVVSKAKANPNTNEAKFQIKLNTIAGYGSKVGGSSFGPNPGIDR